MTKTAYLGIPGSFSYTAAQAVAANTQLQGVPAFKDIFAAINAGTADCGVIPVENSLAGSIYENYDLLDANELKVCGEYYLSVSHCLLGPAPALAQVTRAYSHQKALEQCSGFFKAHPWIKQRVYDDTATAAKFVSEQHDPGVVAIASKQAGALYGLQVLQEKIENNRRNVTRFLIVAKSSAQLHAHTANKCSIIIRRPHTPGSLHQALGILADSGCNLTKIESRPLPGTVFEYVFYLDFCYDKATQPIHTILAELTKIAPDTKLLGLYQQQTFNLLSEEGIAQ